VILYGAGLSDGNLHSHDNVSTLLAGGGSGKIKGGRHLQYSANTPMHNLYGNPCWTWPGSRGDPGEQRRETRADFHRLEA